MEPLEKNLSPHDSLEVIVEAINKTKDDFKDKSFCFMLWGWLIAGASFAFFLLHQYTTFQYYFLPLPGAAAIGILVTLTWYFQRKRVIPTETYLSYFFSRMWFVLGLGFIVVVFVSVSQKLSPFLYILIIAAVGTLTSGLIMKFKPLIIGGILFFGVAVAGVYVPDSYRPLLLGTAMLTGYLIPGYLLRSAKI